MTVLERTGAHGVLTEPATLTIERLLPGPIERVWSYLTEPQLRRQWFADGAMVLAKDAPFEFVWRNDELTDPPGPRPDGVSDEHRMQSRVLAVSAPRHLAITWGAKGDGEVSFDLESRGDQVLLTIVHRRVPDRSALLSVSAGWHGHLDVLAACLAGGVAEPFWTNVARLKAEYDQRFPA